MLVAFGLFVVCRAVGSGPPDRHFPLAGFVSKWLRFGGTEAPGISGSIVALANSAILSPARPAGLVAAAAALATLAIGVLGEVLLDPLRALSIG